MTDNRDDFPPKTIKTVAERVNLRCSNPSCRAQTKGPHTNDEKAVNVGRASHIHAASPGGPRYLESQTPDERSSIENAVWLCSTCSTKVDADPMRFPVLLLRKWKADAEYNTHQELGVPSLPMEDRGLGRLEALPAGTVVNLVYKMQEADAVQEMEVAVFGVDRANNALRFRELVRSFSPTDAVPLTDIQAVWSNGDEHYFRVSVITGHRGDQNHRFHRDPVLVGELSS